MDPANTTAAARRNDAKLARSTSEAINLGPQKLWLDAWSDPLAGLRAFSCCMCTANLFGDGDWRLAIADADAKLKACGLALLCVCNILWLLIWIDRTPGIDRMPGACAIMVHMVDRYGT